MVTGVTTMNRARGCNRAPDNIKCKHCDMLLDVSFSSPKMFWKEVQTANEQVESNVFYEVCDSITSFPTYIDDLVKAKPLDLGFNPIFFVYAQAIDIVKHKDMAKRLKELGVYKVNIGLESGSDITLKQLKGHHDSVENNYGALKLLKEAGIHVYGSFVLGTDYETKATLRETVDWIKLIIKEGLIRDVEAQPILPLPNNYYGKKLSKSGLMNNNVLIDWPADIDKLSELYVNNFSSVNHQECLEAAKEIRAYAHAYGIIHGSGVSREDDYRSL